MLYANFFLKHALIISGIQTWKFSWIIFLSCSLCKGHQLYIFWISFAFLPCLSFFLYFIAICWITVLIGTVIIFWWQVFFLSNITFSCFFPTVFLIVYLYRPCGHSSIIIYFYYYCNSPLGKMSNSWNSCS